MNAQLMGIGVNNAYETNHFIYNPELQQQNIVDQIQSTKKDNENCAQCLQCRKEQYQESICPPDVSPVISPVIYGDYEGKVIKTDVVHQWVNNKHSNHSFICEYLRNKTMNISQGSAWTTVEAWRSKCDTCGNYPIHMATMHSQIDVIDTIIRNGAPINARNDQGETALHLACSENNNPLLVRLLQYGADPNAIDDSGTAPLHIAVAKCQLENALCLLRSGAQANLPLSGVCLTTPLHMANGTSYHWMVDLLINFGADVNARDRLGQTPMALLWN